MANMRLSDDGLYYWDGSRWISTLSPDGRWRWNGSGWVPVAAMVAPEFAPYPSYQQPAPPRRPTPWTKPMQYAVAAWYAVSGLYALSLPFWMSGILWVAAIIGVVFAVVVIIGALARWTWMFYVVLVLLGLSTAGLPLNIIGAVAGSTSINPFSLPGWISWLSVALGVPSTALFVWMLVAG